MYFEIVGGFRSIVHEKVFVVILDRCSGVCQNYAIVVNAATNVLEQKVFYSFKYLTKIIKYHDKYNGE